jgi:hypothetical protein
MDSNALDTIDLHREIARLRRALALLTLKHRHTQTALRQLSSNLQDLIEENDSAD